MFNKNSRKRFAFYHQCSFNYFCFVANKELVVEPSLSRPYYIYRMLSPRNNVFLSPIYSLCTITQLHRCTCTRTKHAT